MQYAKHTLLENGFANLFDLSDLYIITKTNLSKILAALPFFLLLLAAIARARGERRSIKRWITIVPVNNTNRDYRSKLSLVPVYTTNRD
jgi:hypothetical protein